MMIRKRSVIGALFFVSVLIIVNVYKEEESTVSTPLPVESDTTEQPKPFIATTPLKPSIQKTKVVEDTVAEQSDIKTQPTFETPWLSDPINELSNELYDFIESEQVRYINTTDYPFDEEKQTQLSTLAKSGDLIMFDNTDPDYLDNYGVSEAEVVSEYFGTASEGDVIIATAVLTKGGGIHYLVLPIKSENSTDNEKLLDDVKQAVTLLKEQKSDLVKPKSSQTADSNTTA
ncbi:topoisomerase I [Vibrio sp. Of7-15]|uniref:topoisomerase I n=1 Tax=Vibrio sp. Of7-15 TaxID=2724879 RepID=UPI001EF376A1|nr:topoisomerase I [Vibrio sp. Of7-15]MCG7496022.1 topoisomerase I [Vibrio sp. Of7-15]